MLMSYHILVVVTAFMHEVRVSRGIFQLFSKITGNKNASCHLWHNEDINIVWFSCTLWRNRKCRWNLEFKNLHIMFIESEQNGTKRLRLARTAALHPRNETRVHWCNRNCSSGYWTIHPPPNSTRRLTVQHYFCCQERKFQWAKVPPMELTFLNAI